ncbi:hypothetical protein [Sinosporangium siamense]|uniref:SCO6045-like C-terminal domain-containing protein n=1 Tax=Sinosporangium siamense TaxID=1367973 RepID=A0A919V773_9ACTN|nr:hypothetical protein [Sinosporangium siamense]GII93183.1 hypothetical protein Ssi02_34140 [Sinosporangium siamense]
MSDGAPIGEPPGVESVGHRRAWPAPRGGEPPRAGSLKEARAALAAAQAELLAALVAGGAVPEGFDRTRIEAQTQSLAAKRRRLVARVMPELGTALGAEFPRLFAAYAEGRPPPGRVRTDAEHFAAWLRERGQLPEEHASVVRQVWWRRLWRRAS